MQRNTLLIITLFTLLFASSLQAKWWIFGGGEEEVGFDYLYINALSFDDAGQKAVLIEENLDNGYLHVRGKARTGKNPVGGISVSLDGGQTWNNASFERDGGFNYSFEPDLTQTYDIVVKAIDTTGKSNELSDARVSISFSDLDVQGIIHETLAQLKTAYENKDDMSFMRFVDQGFEGDAMTLERALRKDFSALSNIQIDFTLSSVAFSNNRYHAAVFFHRNVMDTFTGTPYSDQGVTEFSFAIGEQGAMLLSMKHPLIFGLTYATEIASGTTASAQNSDTFLTVGDDGNVGETSLANLESSDGNDYMMSGSFILEIGTCCGPIADGFNFENDEKTTLVANSDIYKETNILLPNNGAKLKEYGNVSINGITVADSGYINNSVDIDDSTIGNVIAVQLPNNTYAVLKVTNSIDLGGGDYRTFFDYKYNPSGSRYFP